MVLGLCMFVPVCPLRLPEFPLCYSVLLWVDVTQDGNFKLSLTLNGRPSVVPSFYLPFSRLGVLFCLKATKADEQVGVDLAISRPQRSAAHER